MDPLKELWALYEAVMEKPPLQDEPSPTVDTPQDEDHEHPVSQERRKVDLARAAGMEPEQAHETVYGEVDTGDSASKAQLAATLARVQNDGGRKGIKIEKDKDFKSLLARDDELEQKDAVTPDDMRTPQQNEIPNALQAPHGMENTVGEQVEVLDVWDYNDDVAYLQKYGRA
jgi:hypothetical protein